MLTQSFASPVILLMDVSSTVVPELGLRTYPVSQMVRSESQTSCWQCLVAALITVHSLNNMTYMLLNE